METKAPKPNMASCNKCHWWCFLNSVTGLCKRFPPAAHFEEGHYWPITGRGDWCGEFTPSPGNENLSAGPENSLR